MMFQKSVSTIAAILFTSALMNPMTEIMAATITSSTTIDSQPENTVQIINDTNENPLYVFCAYSSDTLAAPSTEWQKLSGGGTIGSPLKFGPNGTKLANDAGAGTWQVAALSPGETIVLQIPNFTANQAWSLRPLKKRNGKFCTGAPDDCGMPVLVESGKNMVGDMSAVDGVNFLLKYEMTAVKGLTTIDFNTNPCRAIGAPNNQGCITPAKDFAGWNNPPCPAGTCKLQGKQLAWCDAIHTGQCANSKATWSNAGVGYAGCQPDNKFTTYCYSHDDANSSPTFSAPYKMRLAYSDLA
eukprot:Pgem_evm1s11503